MTTGHRIVIYAALAAVIALTGGSSLAQQSTGTPGAPGATTTLDGNYLPNPPAKFGGTINLSAKDSTPYWPPRVVPPQGAPNILLIMTDDQGYGVSGTFGGVIPTPAQGQASFTVTAANTTGACRLAVRVDNVTQELEVAVYPPPEPPGFR
jgi:arylsulfatase